MKLEKFSHVIHITSQVSGVLRPGLTRCVRGPSVTACSISAGNTENADMNTDPSSP